MTTILTVCLGNLCRSPLAERLLAARAEKAGLAWTVHSAGVEAVVGAPMEPSAARELVRLGGSADGFAARRLTAEMVDGADLVLTATKQVRAATLQVAPRAMRRTFTLLEFAELCQQVPPVVEAVGTEALVPTAARFRTRIAGSETDLVDPMGRSAQVHREVADAIARAVDSLVSTLPRS